MKARDAGDKYLRDVLLPKWSRNPTFGHCYWDWDNPVYTFGVASFRLPIPDGPSRAFPNWQTDVRNIMSLGLLPAERQSRVDGRRLLGRLGVSRGQQLLPQVAAISDRRRSPRHSPNMPLWRTAPGRKKSPGGKSILWTYDMHETGVVEDLIDGGIYVAATWFNCGHTWPFRACWITWPGSPN